MKKPLGKSSKKTEIVLRVAIITIIANLVLVVAKIAAGLIFSNLSVVSDAVHSVSDVFTSFFIVGAVFFSSPKRDKKHNYGHEKVEPLIVLLLALVLAGTGVLLGWQGIQGIISPKESEINPYLIGVTVLSIAIKEAMFWYEIHFAKKIKSQMLRADAWHSRSDSLSSLAVLIGLLSNFFIATDLVESIAVIIVALLIIKVAIDITRPAVNQLIDKAAGEDICNKIKETAQQVVGVKAIDNLKTRIFGNSIYADLEIAVDGNLSVEQSHAIAEQVHDTLEALEELSIKHIMVHVNPYGEVKKAAIDFD